MTLEGLDACNEKKPEKKGEKVKREETVTEVTVLLLLRRLLALLRGLLGSLRRLLCRLLGCHGVQSPPFLDVNYRYRTKDFRVESRT